MSIFLLFIFNLILIAYFLFFQPQIAHCQLLNNVSDDDTLEKLFCDDNWLMQEKFDGRRLLNDKKDGITNINKKGLAISSPESVNNILKNIPLPITTDGEIINETYYIFDLLEYDNQNLRTLGAKERYQKLQSIPQLSNYVVEAFFTEEEKRKAFAKFKADKKEGVVFKKIDSPYISGRPASGGNQLKYKFWESATVKVIKQHKTKRSVTVAVYDNNTERDIGNVTIPPNYDIPNVGDFVEVIYLYCHIGEKGKLYQTKYKGIRDDQNETDCSLSQIKFKSSLEEDEEDN